MIFSGNTSENIGDQLHAMAARLFPICRSMTGDGVRETLKILQESVPVEIHEVASGTKVLDWVVPKEWNVRDAYVKDSKGNRVIDFHQSNLHLVSGSMPVSGIFLWSELKSRLYTVPDQPDRVPFRTCHFKKDWGFCLRQVDYDRLEAAGEQQYEVAIDTTVTDGSLTYGEIFLPGETTDEILISSHICHPSLANDNLSGICISARLAAELRSLPKRRFSYRFLFAPATIGAITWLDRNFKNLSRVKHGLILSLLGDPGQLTFKKSREEGSRINTVVEYVLETEAEAYEIREFTPFGYDERQFCSPGINLTMGCLMRTPDGEFKEYHTTGDNLQFIRPEALADSFEKVAQILTVFERDFHYVNLKPYGEPRLGKFGLYESLPEENGRLLLQRAVQWVLNFSDGSHSLLDISIRSGLKFKQICDAADRLEQVGLVTRQL
jgi:aminopeptidase-like protein